MNNPSLSSDLFLGPQIWKMEIWTRWLLLQATPPPDQL